MATVCKLGGSAAQNSYRLRHTAQSSFLFSLVYIQAMLLLLGLQATSS